MRWYIHQVGKWGQTRLAADKAEGTLSGSARGARDSITPILCYNYIKFIDQYNYMPVIDNNFYANEKRNLVLLI